MRRNGKCEYSEAYRGMHASERDNASCKRDERGTTKPKCKRCPHTMTYSFYNAHNGICGVCQLREERGIAL